MSGPNPRFEAALAEAAAGTRPPAIALMHLLMEAAGEGPARDALARSAAAREAEGGRVEAGRLRALLALWEAHPGAWNAVRKTVAGIAHEHHGGTPDDTLRYWAESFDRLVEASPEASVALYSLGSADLLAAATAEIVELMAGWDLLGPRRDALDLGCGIGRLSAALAPSLRSVVGIDISPGMIAEARRRHGGIANLRFAVGSGKDLGELGTGSLDLILAADVFPYLVQAGGGLAEAHVAEMARVLRPGGRALILNFSYRGDRDQDRRDVAEAARRAGFLVLRDGTSDLRSWDAVSFLLAAGADAV